jgi:hypothetical protein
MVMYRFLPSLTIAVWEALLIGANNYPQILATTLPWRVSLPAADTLHLFS